MNNVTTASVHFGAWWVPEALSIPVIATFSRLVTKPRIHTTATESFYTDLYAFSRLESRAFWTGVLSGTSETASKGCCAHGFLQISGSVWSYSGQAGTQGVTPHQFRVAEEDTRGGLRISKSIVANDMI